MPDSSSPGNLGEKPREVTPIGDEAESTLPRSFLTRAVGLLKDERVQTGLTLAGLGLAAVVAAKSKGARSGLRKGFLKSVIDELQQRPAAAQDSAAIVGMWSRYVPSAYMREVIEFRRDGTYTSGLCPTIDDGRGLPAGWCVGRQATPSRRGTYSVQGNSVIVTRGLIRLDPAGSSPEGQETYSWRSELAPADDPPRPSSRPALRRLHLTAADGALLRLNEIPPDKQPSWVSR
jgi:hypothetical protein